ncbi:MAG: YdjY domain-containing protein [Desulfobacterales bacterium]|nr:YdjY domain-containing protein [Desulfobacterales bacterium]
MTPRFIVATLACTLTLTAGVSHTGRADDTPANLPGITVDREAGHLDIDGIIAARDAYLELIACTRGTKEHESLVSMSATAQHTHLALVMLGAKPGSPSRWVQDEKTGRWKGINPTGTPVRITVLVRKDGRWIEQPLSTYIIRHEVTLIKDDGNVTETKRKEIPMGGDTFVFGGSKLTRKGDRTIYEADAEGNAIALVAFEDATLNWPTALSHSNDYLEFYTNTDAIPPAGTPVKLRLRPLLRK